MTWVKSLVLFCQNLIEINGSIFCYIFLLEKNHILVDFMVYFWISILFYDIFSNDFFLDFW